jgi:hypothetical protein
MIRGADTRFAEERRHGRERTSFAPTDRQLAGLDHGLRGAGADRDRLALAEMISEGFALRAQTHRRAPRLDELAGPARIAAISHPHYPNARPGEGKNLGRDTIIIDLWQGV